MTQHNYQVNQYLKHTVSLNKAKIKCSVKNKFLNEKERKMIYH